MNAEDKRILLKICVSIVGLLIVGYLFGFLGVVIGLVAIYFLFKKDDGKQVGEDPTSDAKLNYLIFCGALVVALVLAYLFGIVGVIVGLGLVFGAIYNISFNNNNEEYYEDDRDQTIREKEAYIRQLEEEAKRRK
jgi:predicted PurR-regulated permease PerM